MIWPRLFAPRRFVGLDPEAFQNLENGLLANAMVSGKVDYRYAFIRHRSLFCLAPATEAQTGTNLRRS